MLRIDYLRVAPLPALSFQVKDGSCLTIEGPSGSGKTRLLRAIADLDPAKGDIFLDGAGRNEMSAPDWRRLVRYVSAEPGWWTTTARRTLTSTASGKGEADEERLARTLSTVGLPASLLDEPISDLSTGQRQRLALLRALADEPRVILLDEPTAALDPTAAALVEELIRYQMLAGRIILLVSHDAKLRDRLATDTLDVVDLKTFAGRRTPQQSNPATLEAP